MPMAVPYDDVFDAIKSYLEDPVIGWDKTIAPLIFENEGDNAPDGDAAPWVLVVLESTLYGQESIGGGRDQAENKWDEEGRLWFHTFTPRGDGPREARRIAKGLANMFRGRTLLFEALEFMDADMSAGDPGKENGNYYLLSVSIEWRRIES